jgi:hypothetical protein
MTDRADHAAQGICGTHFGPEWEVTEADIFYAIGHALRDFYLQGWRDGQGTYPLDNQRLRERVEELEQQNADQFHQIGIGTKSRHYFETDNKRLREALEWIRNECEPRDPGLTSLTWLEDACDEALQWCFMTQLKNGPEHPSFLLR